LLIIYIVLICIAETDSDENAYISSSTIFIADL
jgi:hypothetical protein